MTEETLSDKRKKLATGIYLYPEEDVKQAIKKILEGMRCGWRRELIKGIVGEKLT